MTMVAGQCLQKAWRKGVRAMSQVVSHVLRHGAYLRVLSGGRACVPRIRAKWLHAECVCVFLCVRAHVPWCVRNTRKCAQAPVLFAFKVRRREAVDTVRFGEVGMLLENQRVS